MLHRSLRIYLKDYEVKNAVEFGNTLRYSNGLKRTHRLVQSYKISWASIISRKSPYVNYWIKLNSSPWIGWCYYLFWWKKINQEWTHRQKDATESSKQSYIIHVSLVDINLVLSLCVLNYLLEPLSFRLIIVGLSTSLEHKPSQKVYCPSDLC